METATAWAEYERSGLGDPYKPHQFTCEGCDEVHTRLYATTPSGKIRGHLARFCRRCKKRRDNKRKTVHRTPRIIFWTPERKELAASFWREGLTATEIAKRVGAGTRSAVLGLLNRLGLLGFRGKHRKPPEHHRAKHREAQRRYRNKFNFTRKTPKFQRVERAAGAFVRHDADAPPSLNLTIIEVGYDQCRHIAGNDGLCCGHPTVGKTSWCDHHLRVVFGGS